MDGTPVYPLHEQPNISAIQSFLKEDAAITAQQLVRGAFGTYPHADPRYVAETGALLSAMGSVLITDRNLNRRKTIAYSIAGAMAALPYHIVFCNRETDESSYSQKEMEFGELRRRKQIAIFVDPIEDLLASSLLMRGEEVIEVAGKPRLQAVEEIAGCLARFMELRAPENIARIVSGLDGTEARWSVLKMRR